MQPAFQFAQELMNTTGQRNKRSYSVAWSRGSTYSLTTRRPSGLMCRNRHFKEPEEAVGDDESEEPNGTTVRFFQSPLHRSQGSRCTQLQAALV